MNIRIPVGCLSDCPKIFPLTSQIKEIMTLHTHRFHSSMILRDGIIPILWDGIPIPWDMGISLQGAQGNGNIPSSAKLGMGFSQMSYAEDGILPSLRRDGIGTKIFGFSGMGKSHPYPIPLLSHPIKAWRPVGRDKTPPGIPNSHPTVSLFTTRVSG